MRKVLHLIETSEPGGAETVLTYIASNLDPTRYRSLVCVLEEGWLTDHLRTHGLPYVVIENRKSYDPVFLYELVRLIRRERISLMHSHEFMMTVYGSVASKLTGVPLIGTMHGKVYYPDKRRRILALRFAVSLCAKLIAVSDDLRRYLVDTLNFDPRKVMTLHNGIDLTRYTAASPREESRRHLSIPSDALVAGTAGSLFKVKGLEYLLEAAKELSNLYPNFLLIIAGEGDEREALEGKAKELDLGDTVKFLGFCENIPNLLDAIDVYVCSSLSEGLSLSILEATAMSKPVVATDVGGNREIVEPDNSGYLVPPCDQSSLAGRITELFDSSELRERFGRRGREIVEERFSLVKMVQNYQGLYEGLIS
jgi:glycosyltransferase involved in cell wall biosynthesis